MWVSWEGVKVTGGHGGGLLGVKGELTLPAACKTFAFCVDVFIYADSFTHDFTDLKKHFTRPQKSLAFSAFPLFPIVSNIFTIF